MNIIINADDFGRTPEINEAICECFKRGYITNTTMMVNMPYADEAVKLAKENDFWDKVGLHLNLTEGTPFNKNLSKDKLFCDKNGEFTGFFDSSVKTRLVLPKKSNIEVRKEIELQMEKFLSYYPLLLHMDSHHHVHTDLPVYNDICYYFIKYSFKSMRLSRNIGHYNSLKKIYKSFINKRIKRIAEITTNFFTDFDDLDKIEELSANACVGTVELMCHPIFYNEKLKNLWVEKSSSENFEVINEKLKKYKLLSFKDLQNV